MLLVLIKLIWSIKVKGFMNHHLGFPIMMYMGVDILRLNKCKLHGHVSLVLGMSILEPRPHFW